LSSYCHLEIVGYPLIEEIADVHPFVMTIFQDSEKRIKTRLLSERNPLVWDVLEGGEEAEVETAFEYATTVHVAVQRLEIKGFTLEKAQEEFEDWLSTSMGLMQDEPEWYRLRADGEQRELWESFRQEQLELYRGFTFDVWLRSMREVIVKRLQGRKSSQEPPQEPDRGEARGGGL